MSIHALIARLPELGSASIGYGPKHPQHPQPDLAPMLDEFLTTYPFLRWDQGYINYLETYAGAAVRKDDDSVMLDIFGFTSESTHFHELDALDLPAIDEKGFFTFCDGYFRLDDDQHLLGACFDATGTRRAGIYRVKARHEGPPSQENVEIYYYCTTFDEWLWANLEYKGRLPDHLHE